MYKKMRSRGDNIMSAGFAKSVASKLLGKEVEITQGVIHEVIMYHEREIQRKTVICGILKDVLEECLVLEVTESGTTTDVYVNSWSVQTIVELQKGLNIFDIYNPDERKNTK